MCGRSDGCEACIYSLFVFAQIFFLQILQSCLFYANGSYRHLAVQSLICKLLQLFLVRDFQVNCLFGVIFVALSYARA